MKLTLIIPGEPCAQGRPRFSTRGGFAHAYDPAKSRNYKAFIKLVAADEIEKQGWKPTEMPLCAKINAYLSIPSKKSKKFKREANLGVWRPTKKPDLDNIVKTCQDALEGLAYKNDSQIIQLEAGKFYSDEPRVEIELEVAAW